MPGELTGTRRAYDRCGGCSHARQRHITGGVYACTQTDWVTRPELTGDPSRFPMRCTCQRFTEPNESE